MIDTFKCVMFKPSDSSLFRDALLVVMTPTGSIEKYDIPVKFWREFDNETAIRNYTEDRLIRGFPVRKTMWHGSHVVSFDMDEENGAVVCVVHVESDHFDGGYQPHDPTGT